MYKTRKEIYQEYLQSEEWKEKRKNVLDRFCGRCCLCNMPGKHVHHRTYKNLRTPEEVNDLCLLCEFCHKNVHRTVQIDSVAIKKDMFVVDPERWEERKKKRKKKKYKGFNYS